MIFDCALLNSPTVCCPYLAPFFAKWPTFGGGRWDAVLFFDGNREMCDERQTVRIGTADGLGQRGSC